MVSLSNNKCNFYLQVALLFVSSFLVFVTATLAKEIVSVQFVEQSGVTQKNVNFTFGQVFGIGEVADGVALGAELSNGITIPIQVDLKAHHRDGSMRHVIISGELPELSANGTEKLILLTNGNPPAGPPISVNQVLNTNYDVVVTLNIGGIDYSASARELLSSSGQETWLSGPLVTEWLVGGPLKDAAGNAHPHLTARFNIRAYAGLESIRTSVIVENNWTFQPNPRNYDYSVTVTVADKGAVLEENNVTHYRQARWRRVFWWGTEPRLHIKHDARYLMRTGAVPTYDSTLTVPEFRLDEMASDFASGDGLMQIGYMESYMPSPGGRADIAPLPRWAARYLISQDSRAKSVMLGFGEQAGSWPIHYRDINTDLPVSIDDFPDLTVLGEPTSFPQCGGDCSTPYEADMSHQPSLSYVPYLITGDYFHLEELQFWADWDLFYGSPDRHGFSSGLLTWDQIRGQAWGLRTLAHAAYITPDAHPLKSYFVEKLENNIDYYNQNWLDWNPLGYIMNQEWLDLDQWISTWMDDFLTWTFGHISALGFSEADAFAAYKARFPVGRMTDPDMCWILASSYWPTILTPYPVTASSRPVETWKEYRETLILSWDDDGFRGTQNIGGREQDLINAGCNSNTMADILGLQQGEMIGYAWSPEGYPSNLQPALAVAAELGVENAEAAWQKFENRSVKPNWLDGEPGGYDHHPQWAIVPGKRTPNPTSVELISFTGQLRDGSILLSWIAASDLNNYGYEIERRTEQSKFEKIGFVSRNNVREQQQEYSFADKSIDSGTRYDYRLKQLHTDGSFEYSKTISVASGPVEEFRLLNNYPNPFNPNTLIGYELPIRTTVTIKVYDVRGRTVRTLFANQTMNPGKHSISFDAEDLPSGLYVLRITTGTGWTESQKMLLIK